MRTLAECRQAAASILADARDLMAAACEQGGPLAVAGLAFTGAAGGMTREEIAVAYELLLRDAGERAGAA